MTAAGLMFLAAGAPVDYGDLVVKVCTGIGIVLGGLAGLRLRARTADGDELRQLRSENVDLRSDLVAMVGWATNLQLSFAQQGVTIPPPPHLKSQDSDDDKDNDS